MELRVLEYFLTVAQEGNITKAAEVLHITQPTLSRQLMQLEKELDVTLFQRGKREIALTEEGMLLRRRAEEILELADKTAQELLREETELAGNISIGCGELAAVETVAELCGMFREKYPQVSFQFYTATSDVIKERIEKGLLDVGLLLEPIDIAKYEFVRLNRPEEWCVLMRPDSPLAVKEALTREDLKDCRVSTDSKGQLNSYHAQVAYYTSLISVNPDWDLADIYADEGITGTSLEKRDEFKRMVADCREGKIQRVLVKSVSRFGRNTVELMRRSSLLTQLC